MINYPSFIYSSRQTTLWPREWNCDHRPPGVSHLSSEYTDMRTRDAFSSDTSPTCYSSIEFWNVCLVLSPPRLLVGEDAARCTMSSFNLCPPPVFRRSLLPADEWKEAHVDLPCLWQARSFWAAHNWWVRRQERVLTRPAAAASSSFL